MADLISCTVDPGGTGDYTSHQAAETANYGNAGASLVSTDKYVECSLICTNDTADSACTIAGITTDATHYIDVDVPAAYHHKGHYTTGNIYRAAGGPVAGVLNVQIGNVFVHGLLIYINPGGSNNTGFIGQNAGNVLFEDIIVRINGTTSEAWPRGAYFYGATGVYTVRNVLVYDAITSGANKGQGFRVSSNASGTVNFQNCGVVDSDNGFEYDNSGTCNLKNCYVFNISGTEYNGTYSSATYCGHTDGDPGTNGIDFGAATEGDTFRDPSSNNFKIKNEDSVLYGVGEDLSGTFTTDFERQTRNQWSLGPDELELTEVACTVDIGGTGDYSTVDAAETAFFGGTSADFVDNDEYVTCSVICTNGANSTNFSLASNTTDALHTITITVPSAYRHVGVLPTSGNRVRFVQNGTGTCAYLSYQDWVIFEGLACYIPCTGTNRQAIGFSHSDNGVVRDCVCKGETAGSGSGCRGIVMVLTDGTGHIENCVCYNFKDGAGTGVGIWTYQDSSATYTVYNCTTIGCDIGFKHSGGTVDITNNVSFGCTTPYDGTFGAGSVNGYDSGADPRTGGIDLSAYEGTDLFADYTNADFSLKYNGGLLTDENPLYRTGVDLSATFTSDILGANRRSSATNFDVGAFQLQTQARTITVDTGGTGDYASAEAASLDLGTGIPDDLIAYDETVTVEHESSDGEQDTAGYASWAYTSAEVDATRFLTLQASGSYRWAGGDPRTGTHYRLVITTDTALLVQANYTVVDGLTCITVPTTGYPSGIYINADEVTIKNCVAGAMGGVGNSGTYGINWTSGTDRTVYIYNTITPLEGAGIHIGLRSTNGTGTCTIYAYDCSFISPNWDGCFLGNNVTLVTKGCFFHGAGNKDISISGSATISTDCHTNALFHDTAPENGTNWLDYAAYKQATAGTTPGANLTDMFVDPANGDYSRYLTVEADDGIDLSGDATIAITTDIFGVERPATPHIGAAEPTTAAPAGTAWPGEETREDLSASRWSLSALMGQRLVNPGGFPIGGF